MGGLSLVQALQEFQELVLVSLRMEVVEERAETLFQELLHLKRVVMAVMAAFLAMVKMLLQFLQRPLAMEVQAVEVEAALLMVQGLLKLAMEPQVELRVWEQALQPPLRSMLALLALLWSMVGHLVPRPVER